MARQGARMACMATQERPAWPPRGKNGLHGLTVEACMATQWPRMACMARPRHAWPVQARLVHPGLACPGLAPVSQPAIGLTCHFPIHNGSDSQWVELAARRLHLSQLERQPLL